MSDFDGMKFQLTLKDQYSCDVRLFCGFCEAQDLPLDVASLEEWIKHLRAVGYAAATVRRRYYAMKKRLRMMYLVMPFESEDTRAVTLYELERKARTITLPSRATFAVKPTKFFTLEEIKALVRQSDPRVGLIIEFLYTTGLRITEMTEIRKRDLRQESPTIYSVRVTGKRSKERVVYINTGLRRRIQDAYHGDVWLFETRAGTAFDPRNVWVMLRRAGEEILGRILTPHCLRHSFTAHKIKQTGKITGVSLYLGHADIATTLGEYNNELLSPDEMCNGLWGEKGLNNAKSRKDLLLLSRVR